MKRVLLLLLSVCMLAGCARGNAADALAQYGATALTSVERPQAPDAEDYDAQRALREAVAPGQLDSLRDFAIRSTGAVFQDSSPAENRLFSPASLYFALSMLAQTAGGDTRAEILSALATDEAGLQNTGDLYRLLYMDDGYTRLLLANSAWLQTGAVGSFQQDTLDALAQNHYAELFTVNFLDGSAGETMGQWVSQNTNGLLGANMQVSPETVMSLLNTVYFRSEWTDAFQEAATAPGTFHNGDGSESECDFMHKTTQGSFIRNDAFTCASLGLKTGSLSLILPAEGLTPADVLAAESWESLLMGELGDTGYGEIRFQVPKLDYSDSLDLAAAAQALGIQDAFDPASADFSPLCQYALFVSSIRQESTFSMDEKGVEAASYTQIDYAGAAMPTDQAELILDRPFLFLLQAEGAPLFVGIVNTMAH